MLSNQIPKNGFIVVLNKKERIVHSTCDKVMSASAAKVCKFFNGEYSDNSLSSDGEPSKVTKSVSCVTGYNNNKLW